MKTAVEWLAEQLLIADYIPKDSILIDYVIKQAKEMEKEQDKKLYSEEEVNELLNLLEQSIKEINHIKITYKDKGHCVKYLSDCEDIIEQFKNK
jgi:cell division septum initiation protein DivIVA